MNRITFISRRKKDEQNNHEIIHYTLEDTNLSYFEEQEYDGLVIEEVPVEFIRSAFFTAFLTDESDDMPSGVIEVYSYELNETAIFFVELEHIMRTGDKFTIAFRCTGGGEYENPNMSIVNT